MKRASSVQSRRGSARVLCAVAAGALAVTGCALATVENTGGTERLAGPCGRGLVVVSSDFQSTTVALIDTHGAVLSSSMLSAASAPVGLSAALSGDVVLPTSAQLNDEIALIDRYPAAVLTFVNIRAGSVRAQLDVRTGFASNPQDFGLSTLGEAWVSRYETNVAPGSEAFDQGGDVLALAPAVPTITQRVDLALAMKDAPGFLPRPGRMVVLDGRVFVLLAAYDASFTHSAPSRLAVLDAESRVLLGVRVLEGLHGCGALAVEPPFDADGAPIANRRIAVGCSGQFAGTSIPSLDSSGIALLATDLALTELARFSAADVVAQPIGFELDFAGPNGLLGVAFGSIDGERVTTDALFHLDLATGAARRITTSRSRPFELGGVRCIHRQSASDPSAGAGSACSASCFVADGERASLLKLEVTGDSIELSAEVALDDGIGLPPRLLGIF